VLFRYGNRLPVLRFFWHSILRQKTPIRVRIESSVLLIRAGTHDLEVALSCLRDGEFDAAIRASGSRHGLIIDAGGYIGTAAIAFARAFPDSTVVTLEPSSANYEVLTHNVKPYSNIVPINKALSGRDGRLELLGRGTGEWGLTTVRNPSDCENPVVVDNIECVSVQTLLSNVGHEGVDILKLDIEGGEKALLEDSGRWILGVDLIIAELHERIAIGCTRTFYHATESMRDVDCGGEKVMVVRGDLTNVVPLRV